jgi:hypothetical protein
MATVDIVLIGVARSGAMSDDCVVSTPPKELYGERVVRFAGDTTWRKAIEWPEKPFNGSVVAVAIAGYQGEDDGGFVYWLYEDGTVDDSYRVTLAEAIEVASDEGDRLGWIEIPPGA